MIVDGQICGGAAQGIGTCLYEEMPFDAQGQPLASTHARLLLPGATEVPDIRMLHMETPSPYTEFGIKGLGEGGAVGPPAAIVSAVNDALRPLGVEVHDLPLTPASVLAAIEQSSAQDRRQPRMKPVTVRIREAGNARRSIARSSTEGRRRARLVAGCQSLGPMLNLRLAHAHAC